MKITALLLFCLISFTSYSQGNKTNISIDNGNQFYNKQEYQKAANEYRQALAIYPNNTIAKFNLANCLYQQQQKVDAAKMYTGMLATVDQKDMKAKIFYNKGVILSDQKNVEESIEAYKNALRNDPFDKEARENLQKALLELKKKQPPKKDENKDNKKQQQQQKQQQSKMSPKETQQRLQLLQQKEKQVQERIQSEKNKGAGGSSRKDW